MKLVWIGRMKGLNGRAVSGAMLTLLLAGLLAAALNIPLVKAGLGLEDLPETIVSVIFPNGTNSSIGEYSFCDNFTVEITITNVTGLYSCYIGLEWNPEVLECNSFSFKPEGPYPCIFSQAAFPWDYFIIPFTIDNTAGRLFGSYTLTGPGNVGGVNGSGTLAHGEFHVKGCGNSTIKLGDDTELLAYGAVTIESVGVDGYFETPPPIHDVAVTDVTLSMICSTIYGIHDIYSTYETPVVVHVTVRNEGTIKETFNVTAYYDNKTIETQTVNDLTPQTSESLTFDWFVQDYIDPHTGQGDIQHYVPITFSANASTVPGEVDTADNTLIGGTVTVRRPGDCNCDFHCMNADFTWLAMSWWLEHGNPDYYWWCDFNGDGDVKGEDFTILAMSWYQY